MISHFAYIGRTYLENIVYQVRALHPGGERVRMDINLKSGEPSHIPHGRPMFVERGFGTQETINACLAQFVEHVLEHNLSLDGSGFLLIVVPADNGIGLAVAVVEVYPPLDYLYWSFVLRYARKGISDVQKNNP